VQLAGGKLLLIGPRFYTTTPDALQGAFYNFASGGGVPSKIEPIDSGTGVLTTLPSGQKVLAQNLDFADNTLQTYFPGCNEDDFTALWRGTMTVGGPNLPAGPISLAMRSDDGNIFYIDYNNDGDFGDAGNGSSAELGSWPQNTIRP